MAGQQEREVIRLAGGFTFLESPRWHDGRMWVSDMYDARILAIDSSGGVEEMLRMPGQPSGLGWLPDGRLQVVSRVDAHLLRATGRGEFEVGADLSGHVASFANDMIVDSSGRAYVGFWGYDLAAGEAMVPAGLVRVEPDGRADLVADELLFPNGMALLQNETELLVAETMGSRITSFPIGGDGCLGPRSVWASVPGCLPDGIAADAEGALWVADAGAHRVIRVERGGQITDSIDLGRRRAYACALGGPDGTSLFICSAESFLPDVCRARMSAAIEVVEVAVPAG